jgi:hypothetical protein
MDAAIDRSELQAQTLYRGIRTTPERIDSFVRSVGTVVSDPAFVSTAKDENIAKSFFREGKTTGILMEIKIPDGAKGAFVSQLSKNRYEEEVLLPRGSKFKILNLVPGEGGLLKIVAELVI